MQRRELTNEELEAVQGAGGFTISSTKTTSMEANEGESAGRIVCPSGGSPGAERNTDPLGGDLAEQLKP